jgi:hypothetical protein
MLDRLDKGMTICEVGIEAGNFANEILSRCEPGMLHTIEVDLSRLTDSYAAVCNDITAAFPTSNRGTFLPSTTLQHWPWSFGTLV